MADGRGCNAHKFCDVFLRRGAILIKLILILLFGLQVLHAKAETIIFSNSTEESTQNWQYPSEELAKKIVTNYVNNLDEDRAQFNQDHKQKLAHNFRQFFAIKKIALSATKSGEQFWFLRPRSDSPSQSFYGAHIFTYWLVDSKNNVLFSRSGDIFNILKTQHNGMQDLLAEDCYSGACYGDIYVFKESNYVVSTCQKRPAGASQPIEKCDAPD